VRHIYSIIGCCVVAVFLLYHRASHPGFGSVKPLNVTAWDAFGYYMYLPSIFIYHDMTDLEWLPEADSTYVLTGGTLYQANRKDNGNYVFKYLGGVSIMQMPLFFIGHLIALNTSFKADGFSPPYQYAIAFGAVIYCILALFLLRRLLRRYFSDLSVAVSILLVVLATNLPQYIAVDGGMSHAYIFPLYVIVLYTTMRWHETPRILWASLTGLTIGLATISRPTEVIMLFIPLLWNTHNRKASRAKWEQVKQYRTHLYFTILFGLLGVLPQLLYWKIASGSFFFNPGSKWSFLDPFFRVLFGWESGWFIYTPVTIFFITGFFFIRKHPFQRSVIVFCFLNIWIIISWFDWKYGATYSTRALVQSYPVFALPFTAFIDWIRRKKWSYLFYLLGVFLIFLNLFQLKQFYTTVLHHRDMTRQYYGRIFLNRHPTPLDVSLMDTREFLKKEDEYRPVEIYSADSVILVSGTNGYPGVIADFAILQDGELWDHGDFWLRITADIKVQTGFLESHLTGRVYTADTSKYTSIRLANPITMNGASNTYEFYLLVPGFPGEMRFNLQVTTTSKFEGTVENVRVVRLSKKEPASCRIRQRS